MKNSSSRLLFGCLGSGILLLVVTLAGCGVTSTSGTSSAPESSPSSVGQPTSTTRSASSTPASTGSNGPQLTCVLHPIIHPIDTVSEALHCTIAHVAGTETAFVLRFTVTTNTGPHTFSTPCQGALSGGGGSCNVIFPGGISFSRDIDKGTVAGATLPGPVPTWPGRSHSGACHADWLTAAAHTTAYSDSASGTTRLTRED